MEPIAECTEFEGEGSPEQIMALMDEELAMVLEMSEAEGLDLSSLADMKCHPDWLDWEKAIHKELTVLQDVKTWVLMDPPGANIVGSKWVFHVKKDADGNIACKKAHLIAQGFSQVLGVDYFDMHVPVAHPPTIRTVLALTAHYDMDLHQIDIKGAYLNGELTGDEVIYM